ncbi:MAG: DUF2807 domain-containing protein [Chloroflexi bacterium]|nr:DUF2807 domain-containing protein [Chloroflexota bacterium]
MSSKWKILASLGALSLASLACGFSFSMGEVDGELVREERAVSGFDEVKLEGSGRLQITQDGSEGLRIEARQDVLEKIETRVDGDELIIGFKPGTTLIDSGPIYFYLSVDDLERVHVSGSGNVDMQSLDTPRLEAVVSGSGNMDLDELQAEELNLEISGSGNFETAGEVDQMRIDVSGSGECRMDDLRSQTADVKVSGSGDVVVWVEESLDINISGSGAVKYYGRPQINEHISGSGRVASLGEK